MTRPGSLEEFEHLRTSGPKTGDRILRKVRMRVSGGIARPLPTEHEEQVTLFAWAAIHQVKYPSLEHLIAIPNAGAGAQSGQAGKMKAEGVRPGVSDTFLPLPSPPFHGAWCELKALDGKLTPEQDAWLCAMRDANYAVCLAYGWEQARNFFLDYIGGQYFHSVGYFPGTKPR